MELGRVKVEKIRIFEQVFEKNLIDTRIAAFINPLQEGGAKNNHLQN